MLNKIKSVTKFSKNKKVIPPRRTRAGGANDSFVVNKTIFSRLNIIQLKSKTNSFAKSDRSKTHSLSLKRRRVVLLLVFACVVSAFLVICLTQLTASLSVKTISRSSSLSVDNQYYTDALSKYMNTYLLARFRFMFNKERAYEFLKEQYPEIESITDLGKPSIYVTEYGINFRQPVASWRVGSKKYYVDKTGVAFEKNYYDEPNVDIVDDSGVKTNDVLFVASNRLLSFVSQVVVSAQANGYRVSQAIIPEGTTRQLDIKVDGVAGIIKLTLNRDPREQIEDMVSAITYFNQKGIITNQIDIRVKNKAYYK